MPGKNKPRSAWLCKAARDIGPLRKEQVVMPFGPANGRLPVVVDARVVTEQGGGPDKTILNSPRFLPSYRNLCAYMHPPGDPGFNQLRTRAEACSAPLLSIPDRGLLDYRVLVELLNLCRREHVRIWHGHDYKSNA